jgi:hypothetical protein
MMVYTPQMVNQACEQKAEVTLSHQGNTRLNAMIAAIGARPGIIVPPGLTSNRLKARWRWCCGPAWFCERSGDADKLLCWEDFGWCFGC